MAKEALKISDPAELTQELETKIKEGRIIFDPGKPLKDQLLLKTGGTKVTHRLRQLVLHLASIQAKTIRISSLVRNSGHHGEGRALDIGNEEIGKTLLPLIASDAEVQKLGIDELIFDAKVAGEADRNKWNYDQGKRHTYREPTITQHNNHIHISVKA